jgi:hypothetical protein
LTRVLTAFTWGYWGWGNATRDVVHVINAVEEVRGYGPPVFADVRAKRTVRAVGFRGDSFERAVGRDHYRWLGGLGNAAVMTGRGRTRLIRPEDAFELLGLIVAQGRADRRVIIFCSCESPWRAPWCHRQLVARALREAAKAQRVRLVLQEWPGGKVSRATQSTIDVPPGTLRAVRAGQRWVTFGQSRPKPSVLGLPVGALVSLVERRDSETVSLCPPRFVNGTWKFELFLPPDPSRANLVARASHERRRLHLEPRA